ncbi:MAG: hypothetical protein KC777_21120 [Cyanobacteria bacterium HKST-UBA02]|nr:hypothetical protein [Cyanobacteria bacterium HKST-UBA02]
MGDEDKKLGKGLMKDKENVAEKLLAGIENRGYTGEQTIAWLRNVSEDVDAGPLSTNEDLIPHMTMLSCVDTLFDHFLRYCLQYNRAETDANARVDYSRPVYGQDSVGTLNCTGRLNTARWSMVVDGQVQNISVFLVPPSVTDARAKAAEYPPILELKAAEDRGGLIWKAESSVILFDHLPVIAKKLFARLIRVAKGQVQGNESFDLGLEKEKAAQLGQTQKIRAAALPENIDQLLEINHVSIAYAFGELIGMLDADLEQMMKMGVQALRTGDKDANEKLTRRTKALSVIKNQVKAMSDAWRIEGGR